MTGLQDLTRMHRDRIRVRYPNLPESAIAAPKYATSTANGLTRAIVSYIDLRGGWATRVSTTGRMLNGRYIPGTTKRGTPDIIGQLQGVPLNIEVKIGRDRQSPEQKIAEQRINAAGGNYFIARDFESFYLWINQLIPKI